MGEFGFYLAITILVIATSGDPDLLDAAIHHLNDCQSTTQGAPE